MASDEIQRLQELLRKAVGYIEGLGEQQAMPDVEYNAEIDQFLADVKRQLPPIDKP